MKALDMLKKVSQVFERAGVENPSRESELIIAHCLGMKREQLYITNPLIPGDVISMIDSFVERRSKREPLQYILGYADFYGIHIKVGRGVLIPRPETELLVEEAIKTFLNFDFRTFNPAILDLCTGSGCVAIALARAFPDAEVYGIDTSREAIQYAKDNAEINKIKNITFLEGSLFEPVRTLCSVQNLKLNFDLIVTNPPYIKKGDLEDLQPEIVNWEPIDALNGGVDGLYYYKRIIPEANIFLKKKGALLFELGISQADTVIELAQSEGFRKFSLVKDYAGIERILTLGKD